MTLAAPAETEEEARDEQAIASSRGRRWWRIPVGAVGIFAFYAFVAVVVAAPHRAHLGTSIIGDTGDPSLFMWSWRWESHIAVTGDWGQLWRGNFFFPNHYPVAYTEHVIALMPLYAIFEWVTGNSVYALNLVFLSLFALAGTFGCYLGREVTRSWPGGIFAGLAFGFSPFRFGQITHYHIAAVFTTAAAFILLRRLVIRPRLLSAVGLGLVWALQMLTSFYLGAICLAGMGVYLLIALIQARGRQAVKTVALAGAGLLVGLILIAPLTLPYLTSVRSEISQERSIEEIGAYSTTPQMILSPSGNSFLYSRVLGLTENETSWELQLFLGVGLGLAAGIGFLLWREPEPEPEPGAEVAEGRVRRILKGDQTRWAGVAASGLIFSFGPYFGLPGVSRPMPLPYRVLMYLPGFKGLRVPSRFALLFYLGLAVLGAMGVSWIWRRGKFGKVAVAGLAVLMLAEFSVTVPVSDDVVGTADRMPSYVAWLRDAPPGPVIEMPMYREGVTGAVRQGYRQYVSTFDWKPRVNGYSGYFPYGYKEMVEEMRGFPDAETIRTLEELGVRYVVIHYKEYDEPGQDGPGLPTAAELQAAVDKVPALVPVHYSNPTIVYELAGVVPR